MFLHSICFLRQKGDDDVSGRPLLRPTARLLLLASVSVAGITLGAAYLAEAQAAAVTLATATTSTVGVNVSTGDNLVFQGGTLSVPTAVQFTASTGTASTVNNLGGIIVTAGNGAATFSAINATGASARGALNIQGSSAGAVTITGAGTFDGGINVTNGTLLLTGSGSVASSFINLAGAQGAFGVSGASGNSSVAGLSSVSGSTVTLGSKTLTISGRAASSNIISGTISSSVSGASIGTIALLNSGTGVAVTSTATATGVVFAPAANTSLDLSAYLGATKTIGGLAGAGTVLIGNATLAIVGPVITGTSTDLPSFSGAIYNTGTSASTGGLTISAAAAPTAGQIAGQVFSGNTLTFTGATTINSGATLGLFTGASIAASSGVTVNTGGTLSIGGAGTSETGYIKGLAGTGSVVLNGVSGAADTLAIVGAGATFSGVMSGTYGNVALASGTQTLSGASTYGGTTTIASPAVLNLSGSGSLTNSAVTVSTGGTLNIATGGTGATGTIAGLNGNGTVSITAGNTLLLNTSSSNSYSGAIAATTGAVTVGGTGTQIFTATQSYTGKTTVNSGATLAMTNLSNIALSNTSANTLVINQGGTVALTGAVNQTEPSTWTVTGAGTMSIVSGATINFGPNATANTLIV